jgi:hypothetical protein
MLQYTDDMTGPTANHDWVENAVLVKFHKCCVEEIRRHKWLESEKCGFDIGWTAAKRDWYRRYARDFHHNFSTSRA